MTIVRLIDMPYGTKAVTALDGNGDYIVYINSRYDYETQKIAFEHEMIHINKNHFYSGGDVARNEREADRFTVADKHIM